MYVGHLGVALAGKGWRREAPLWLLVLATQGCDWVQVVACMAAPGSSPMWSHSIAAVLALATVLLLGSYGVTQNRQVALLTAAVVVSHVLLDYVTGVKPTWPGGPMIGLNLYDHPIADFALETAVVCAGWLVYRRSLPLEVRGTRLAWLFVLALVGIQLLGAFDLAFLPRVPKCV